MEQDAKKMGMEMKKLSGMAMLLWMWIENGECGKVMWEGEEQDIGRRR